MWRRLTVRVSSWGALAKIEMAEGGLVVLAEPRDELRDAGLRDEPDL